MTSLVDTSVWARRRQPAVAAELERLLVTGQVRCCDVVRLEVGVIARSVAEHVGVQARLGALPAVDVDDEVTGRALEVQEGLVARGHHRGVGLPDLLIAACAERAGVEVLHYDHDFDLISEVTGQPTRWVAPRGSVD